MREIPASETERIELAEGIWWEVEKEEPWAVNDQCARILKPLVKANEDGAALDITVMDTVLLSDFQTARLVGCTTAWSFDLPITMEGIKNRAIKAWMVRKVMERMNDLYQAPSEEDEKALKKV
jgi:hypothetical protein